MLRVETARSAAVMEPANLPAEGAPAATVKLKQAKRASAAPRTCNARAEHSAVPMAHANLPALLLPATMMASAMRTKIAVAEAVPEYRMAANWDRCVMLQPTAVPRKSAAMLQSNRANPAKRRFLQAIRVRYGNAAHRAI